MDSVQWTTYVQLINPERSAGCTTYLYASFVDFEKAFDSVETNAILESLSNQGINKTYVHLLKDIYTGCSSTMTLDNANINISINKGVRQGETISSKLFTAYLDYVFKELQWEDYGVNINGEKLNHLKFTDPYQTGYKMQSKCYRTSILRA